MPFIFSPTHSYKFRIMYMTARWRTFSCTYPCYCCLNYIILYFNNSKHHPPPAVKAWLLVCVISWELHIGGQRNPPLKCNPGLMFVSWLTTCRFINKTTTHSHPLVTTYFLLIATAGSWGRNLTGVERLGPVHLIKDKVVSFSCP